MKEHETTTREVIHAGEMIAGHVIALIVGVILMLAGIAMGVTLVLLPIGIPVGFAGLAVFMWALFGRAKEA